MVYFEIIVMLGKGEFAGSSAAPVLIRRKPRCRACDFFSKFGVGDFTTARTEPDAPFDQTEGLRRVDRLEEGYWGTVANQTVELFVIRIMADDCQSNSGKSGATWRKALLRISAPFRNAAEARVIVKLSLACGKVREAVCLLVGRGRYRGDFATDNTEFPPGTIRW